MLVRFELFVITLFSKSLSKLLLLIASNVSTSVSSDGADSISFVERWSCWLFNWSLDVSFSFSFLFSWSFQGFLLSFILYLLFLSCGRFCGLWCDFSTIQFSLNHSTFFPNSSLALGYVDLHSSSQCSNNFSVSSLEWCSGT